MPNMILAADINMQTYLITYHTLLLYLTGWMTVKVQSNNMLAMYIYIMHQHTDVQY